MWQLLWYSSSDCFSRISQRVHKVQTLFSANDVQYPPSPCLMRGGGGGGVSQPGHWPGAHRQKGSIFIEQKNVLYIILTVER